MGNRTNYGTGRMTVDNRQKNERSRSGNPYSSHVKAGKHAGTVYNFKRKSRIRKSLTRLPILLEFIHKYIFLNFVSFYNGLNSNRIFAAEKLGYRKVPSIIRYMTDDQAVIAMVDSNLQRERIQPSEKAFAYKMKYDVLKRKSGRRKAGQVDHNSGKKGLEIISEETGDSPKQVQRYIKMADLIPELLEKVDDGSMGFTPAVQIAYLKKKEQKDVLDAMELTLCTPLLSQAMRMKKLSADGKLTTQRVEDILSEIKQKETDRVVFKNDQLHKYFPKNYSTEQMKREIIELLKLYVLNY